MVDGDVVGAPDEGCSEGFSVAPGRLGARDGDALVGVMVGEEEGALVSVGIRVGVHVIVGASVFGAIVTGAGVRRQSTPASS